MRDEINQIKKDKEKNEKYKKDDMKIIDDLSRQKERELENEIIEEEKVER
jgi:hypothetical protein